jgi:HEAT repeat protein
MTQKLRLLTVILVGVVLGAIIVRIQEDATPLDQRLVTKEDITRRSALRSFDRLPDDKKAPVVAALLQKHVSAADPRERRFALYAIRKSGVSSDAIRTAQVSRLTDADAKVAEEARTGLVEEGDAAAPQLVEALASNNVREAAINILIHASPGAVPALRKGLDDSRLLVRRGVTRILTQLTNEETRVAARELIPDMARDLASEDDVVRYNAAFAIHALDRNDVRPVKVFMEAVRRPDWNASRGWGSFRALIDMPAAAPDVAAGLARLLPKLEDGFEAGVNYRRPAVADALEKLAPRGRKVSDLTFELKNNDPVIRYRAVLVAGSSPTAALGGALNAAMTDSDPYVAARAVWALGRLGPEEIGHLGAGFYPRLFAAMNKVDDRRIRGFHAMAGKAVAPLGAAMLPTITDAVKHDQLKLEAANALVRDVGGEATAFFKALLNDRNNDARLMAAIALARLAPDTPGLKAELQQNEKRFGPVGDQVREALGQTGG